MISFRYAENLAGGNGFVYNIGEHVLGTTSPLWTIILAATRVCGLDISAAAVVLAVVAAALSTALIYSISTRLGLGIWAALPALIYALHPRSITSDISGLETALFTILIVVTLWCLLECRYAEASVVAALAVLARPEGVAGFLVVFGVVLWKQRLGGWRTILVPTLMLAAWAIFSWQYFGSIIPNSMLAKSMLYSSDSTMILKLASAFFLNNPTGWVLWPLVLIGISLSRPHTHRLGAIALFVVGYLAAIAIFSPRIFFWYSAPMLPFLSIVATAGLARFSEWAGRLEFRFATQATTRRVAFALALTSLVAATVLQVGALYSEMRWYRGTHLAAAEYLGRHALSGDRLLAEDIGHLGYRYRGRVIDRDGLVTPGAIAYNASRRYADFVDSVGAEWVFLAVTFPTSVTILADSRFQSDYVPVANVLERQSSHQLFRRIR